MLILVHYRIACTDSFFKKLIREKRLEFRDQTKLVYAVTLIGKRRILIIFGTQVHAQLGSVIPVIGTVAVHIVTVGVSLREWEIFSTRNSFKIVKGQLIIGLCRFFSSAHSLGLDKFLHSDIIVRTNRPKCLHPWNCGI